MWGRDVNLNGEIVMRQLSTLTAAAAVLLGVFPDAGLSFYRLAWQAATSVVSSGELMGALP